MKLDIDVTSVTMSEVPYANEEMLVGAVLRELIPHDRVSVVFSKVAAQIAAYTGQKFVDLVGEKPSELAARYLGKALTFTRDNCKPPLLWVRRNVGPWTPIPTASAEVVRWASQNACLEFGSVDFAGAGASVDHDVVMIAWLRARGDYRRAQAVPMPSSEAASAAPHVRIGARYMARVVRVAYTADGLVCELTSPEVAGGTGFLPSASLPLGTGVEAMLGREIAVKVVGRRAGSVLLNPDAADQQPLSQQGLARVIESIQRIREDAEGILDVLRSLETCHDPRAATPLAEGVLRRCLARVIREGIHAWICRGGAQVAEVPSAIPEQLIAAKDEDAIPYAQVAAAIAAL